jgi:hypothetical protein
MPETKAKKIEDLQWGQRIRGDCFWIQGVSDEIQFPGGNIETF